MSSAAMQCWAFSAYIVLPFLFYCCGATVGDTGALEVEVSGRWLPIVDYHNDNDHPVTIEIKWIRGLKSSTHETSTVRATHSAGLSISAGVGFKIMDVTAQITTEANYQYTRQTEVVSMQHTEIMRSFEFRASSTVSPRSRLIKWQLIVDVAGNDIGFNKIIDSVDPGYIAKLSTRVTAQVILLREIESTRTIFRIKHKELQKYIAITRQNDWPTATLWRANNYYFYLRNVGYQMQIVTLNSTDHGYYCMSTGDKHGIYFDICNRNKPKQLWTVSKQLPLRDMEIVTFRNVYWSSAFLCNEIGTDYSVCCHYYNEDEWMLEIVGIVGVCQRILIQQHVDQSNFFNRTWNEYKAGFGNTSGNYWLGNEQLHTLTRSGMYKLRFEIQSTSGLWYWAEYGTFIVGDESTQYTLTIIDYNGDAGVDASFYHSGMKFSTKDRDNDEARHNCAMHHGGGFWYNACAYWHVNGAGDYFTWWYNRNSERKLRASRMWLVCG